MATTPTTTPTAIPTVFGLLELLLDPSVAEAACVAVTSTVLGPSDEVDVLVDGDPLVPVTDDGSRLPTLFLVTPVNSTHHRLSPPQFALS